jgi:8-oxo-dGTP pyrophosphatase MutT (NUDIX family)
MTRKPAGWYAQSGVIPYRVLAEASAGTPDVEVLLITSRKRKRWVIPKGIVEPDLTAQQSAVKEAYEEAGIRGEVSDTPIGMFQYEKWGGICVVDVFLLNVTELLTEWPEADLRDREWMSVTEAAGRVREKELQRLLLRVPDVLATP